YYSEDQYDVSIKEDTTYPRLHSPKTTKELRSIRRIQKESIRRIQEIVCEYSGRYQMWSLLQETPIRRIQKESIRRIQEIVCEYSGRYQMWSLLQETPIRRIQPIGYAILN
ncbi:hypothetical protein Tco_0171736, partial [Tanacetum coccineum]